MSKLNTFQKSNLQKTSTLAIALVTLIAAGCANKNGNQQESSNDTAASTPTGQTTLVTAQQSADSNSQATNLSNVALVTEENQSQCGEGAVVGSACLMTKAQAVAHCASQQQFLPTQMDYARLAQTRGSNWQTTAHPEAATTSQPVVTEIEEMHMNGYDALLHTITVNNSSVEAVNLYYNSAAYRHTPANGQTALKLWTGTTSSGNSRNLVRHYVFNEADGVFMPSTATDRHAVQCVRSEQEATPQNEQSAETNNATESGTTGSDGQTAAPQTDASAN